MDDFYSLPPDAHNPVTRRKHRRETFWQITLPATIIGVITVLLIWLAWNAIPGTTSRWADISTIMLIMPMLFFALITVVIQIASIYALVRLIKVLPFYSFQGFNLLIILGVKVGMVGDRLVRPFLEVRAYKASLQTFGRSLKRTQLRRK